MQPACQPRGKTEADRLLKAKSQLALDDSLKNWFDKKAYLAFAASDLYPDPEDVYGRAGWWMLNFSVAAKYGLAINSTVDERFDFFKSTEAARGYYSHLQEKFGDVDADLMFLTSPLLVKKYLPEGVLADTSHCVKECTWLIVQIRNLEKSRRYFQSVISKLGTLESPVTAFDTIQPNQKVYFKSLSEYLKISESELKRINPAYISNVYEPGSSQVPLVISRNKLEKFTVFEDSIYAHTNAFDEELAKQALEKIKRWKDDVPDQENTNLIFHNIRSGDNLSRIAKKYRVSVSKIKRWNNLRSSRIYAGKRLKIYVNESRSNPKSSSLKSSGPTKSKKRPTFGKDFKSYTIESGDTLWSISKKYKGVTPDDIMKWNQITANIKPGQVIYIKSGTKK